MSLPLLQLREKHPRFLYHGYRILHESEALRFSFDFELEPDIRFSPEVVIEGLSQQRILRLGQAILNNIAFHLGLIEIPSYWKVACSPQIIVRAGTLDEYQLTWWKHLLINGQGEFFFTNNIDFTQPDFVRFATEAKDTPTVHPYQDQLDNKVLVPIGGGKDSAVTCELLRENGKDLTCWCLNPTPATLDIMRVSQISESIVIRRRIDQNLLKLNAKGYLNGHTPFSAYLAFLSTACAILFNIKSIAVSNERSSNEGNAFFKGVEINHQYSKSFDFERRFRDYSARYLAESSDYFSFLRPLYELQIAKIFSRFPQYFSVFRSCNKGQKTNSWCHKCAKCLFAFTILYPFLQEEKLVKHIFSENLFEKEDLAEVALDLLGEGIAKPFECVGSVEETMVAFYMCIKEVKQRNTSLPIVLRVVEEKIFAHQSHMEERMFSIINSWNNYHAIPKDFEELLEKEANL